MVRLDIVRNYNAPGIAMNKVNLMQVLRCGLVTGLVWTLLSIALIALVGSDFMALVSGDRLVRPAGALQTFFILSNIAAGFWTMWLYAAIRPRYGPGPRTALIAALAWWIIASMQGVKWIVLLGVPLHAAWPMLATLPAIMIATMAGAWGYRE